ncbi:penicillin-binding protein activator [Luteimonas sp. e5]
MRAVIKHLALACCLLWLSACVSTPTQTGAGSAPTRTTPAAFTEAHELALADGHGNAARIQRLLATLDDAVLTRQATALSANDPLYPHVAQVMLQRGLQPPHALERGLDLSARAPADRDGYRPPNRIAVLLPLSGGLSAAAKPVRDGFLAGYYAERRPRPPINFYDSATGVAAAYRQAVADGADYVVGPLDRAEVDALLASQTLNVPLLALNRGQRTPPPGSITFSLAPEDEGVAAAEYLIAQGARTVLLLAGSEDSLRRLASTFAEHFAARGGRVQRLPVDADAQALATAAAQGAVDTLYFAARGSETRAALARVATQPALSGARRVASSQIGNDLGSGSELAVLEGVVFPSESVSAQRVTSLPADAGALTPTARGAAARLFAFGHDAWLISVYPERVADPRQGGLAGATGDLRLDSFGNVLRMPVWSVLRGGVAMPLGGR